jgi:fructokinase
MRIGVDLGGSKIEAIALADDGAELLRRRVATPAGDYEATLAAICDLVHGLEAAVGRRGTIGVGCPGALSSRTGLIKNSNSIVLNGKPLDRDLADRLGRPVRLENDANCFALSEAVDGAGRDAGAVFGVILGTGVGGGLVFGKHVVSGHNRIAGEWGHNPLPWPRADELPGPPCYCGKRGCVETFLCGPALARQYADLTGRMPSAAEIAGISRDGDENARACITRYVDRLARGLASVVNVLDPDVIVLGGGLSNIELLYAELPVRLAGYAFSDGIDTVVAKARHGDSSGVRGAAWLWPARGR